MHSSSIAEALKSPLGVESLTLEVAGTKLPDALFDLRALRQLTIKGGTLTTLSPRLAELEKLVVLDLDKHPKLSLEGFPVLPALESLGLRNCRLRSLPDALFSCESLRALSLGMNPLGSVPAGIGKLRKLERLYLWGCRLETVSPEIGALTRLRLLELEKNSLASLPAELSSLVDLEELHLEKNAFEELPSVIFAHDNRITELPAAVSRLARLEVLRLENNPITRFPRDLSALAELTTFYLSSPATLDVMRQQTRQLPPKAFVMSFGAGDIARDGRWADEKARPARDILPDAAAAELHVLHHEGRVSAVAFVRGGVAGAGYDALRVFDLPTGTQRFVRDGFHRSVSASPDGALLVAAAEHGVSILSSANGAVVETLDEAERVSRVEWSRDGRLLLILRGKTPVIPYQATEIRIHDLKRGKTLATLREPSGITFATLSSDGQRVLLGVKKTVRLWDWKTGAEPMRSTTRFAVGAGQLGEDGRSAYSAGPGDGLLAFDTGQAKPKGRGIGALKPGAFTLLPDGKRLLIAGPAVQLASLESGEVQATLGAHEEVGPVDAIVVSPDGALAASCGCDKTVRLWRLPP